MDDKDVQRDHKKYQTCVGAKATETLIESFPSLATKVLGTVVRAKKADALQTEPTNDYIITKQLSSLAGGLALRCGRLPAFANPALITTKHINFIANRQIVPTGAEKSSALFE